MTLGALAVFAAVPAMASTAQPHAPCTRYERISGFSNGLLNSLPVQVTGSVFDYGTLRSPRQPGDPAGLCGSTSNRA